MSILQQLVAELDAGRIPRGAWVLLHTGWSRRTGPLRVLALVE